MTYQEVYEHPEIVTPSAFVDLYNACEEFVRKCECGEARSRRSYSEMKSALAKVKRPGKLAELLNRSKLV